MFRTNCRSGLGQAVRNAQALGLDKGAPGANPLETQVRRLIWWELFNCDAYVTYQL